MVVLRFAGLENSVRSSAAMLRAYGEYYSPTKAIGSINPIGWRTLRTFILITGSLRSFDAVRRDAGDRR